MKRLIIAVMAIALCTTAAVAQDTTKMHNKMMHHEMKDCVMMKDGKMEVMKAGKTMSMSKDMTMTDGTMVMTDGNVKMKDGKTMMLKEGDCVMMDGKVKKMGMKKKM